MGWRERIAAKQEIFPECPDGSLTELTEPPFVSFGSEVDGRSRNIDGIRGRLLALAAAEFRDPAVVHALPESDLRAYAAHVATFPPEQQADVLRALLSMLLDDADRKAGRVPQGDTAAILCRHCGPVYVAPSIAAVLPVVNGWPRALG